MNNTIKKLIGFSFGSIVGALFSAITVPITTRFLLPEEYGKTGMFSLMCALISMILYFGYDQAYIREYYEEKNHEKLLSNALLIPALIIFLIWCVSIPLSPIISKILFLDTSYYSVVVLYIFSLPLILLQRFILIEIRMKEKAFEYSLCSLICKFFSFFITLFFLFYVRKDFLAIIYSVIIAEYITGILLYCIYRKAVRVSFKSFDKSLLKRMSLYALPLVPATIIGTIFNGEDKILIKYFSTYEELGYYQVAMTLANMLGILQVAFSTFWTPTVFRWKEENVNDSKYVFVQKCATVVFSVLFILIVLFRNLIPVLLSSTYENAKYIFPFLLISPIMTVITYTSVCGIQFKRKSNYSLIIAIVVVIINLILNIILIPSLGAIGAAIATGISHIADFWIKAIVSRNLWFKFELRHFVFATLIIMIIATANTFPFFSDLVVYIIDIIGLLFLIFLYRKELINIIEHSFIGRKTK